MGFIPQLFIGHFLRFLRREFSIEIRRVNSNRLIQIVEATPYDLETISISSKFSMQSQERIWSIIQSTKYIVANDIKGSFVECGVYKGGTAIAISRTLASMGVKDREIWLFDTYQGMTNPTEFDSHSGSQTLAAELLSATPIGDGENIWASASLKSVQEAVKEVDYPFSLFKFVVGDVLETLTENIPSEIAFLRLDTDWYESTKFELKQLEPRVADQGVVIIDDYGHWSGAKKAVDEYLEEMKLSPMVHYLDYTGRCWVKKKVL